MRACGSARRTDAPQVRTVAAALALLLQPGALLAATPEPVRAQDVALSDVSLQSTSALSMQAVGSAMANVELYLQTFVNGVDSGLISPYRLIDGRLHADAAELRQLGFRIEETWIGFGGLVELSRIPGLVYRLDTLRQVVDITVDAAQLESHRYDASAEVLRPQVSPGAVLNYDTYAQESRNESPAGTTQSQLLSSLLDLRAFAALGNLQQTALFRSADPEPQGFEPALRLDTTFFRSDPDRLDTWRAGDLISGASLAWVTPVRLGGLQWQRNFRLQPNLVTFPLPTIRGSAAVPSTVDVLVNNIQQFSRTVEPGPFSIENVPVITGQGEIRVVVRDALGREQLTTLPFYASGNLLRPGLVDYSLETGYLRRNFGLVSNDYDSQLAGSGSVRVGVSDWATLEGHGEGKQDLVAGGLGGIFRAGVWGVFSTSFAASERAGELGEQGSLGYQWQSGSFGVLASTQRSSYAYRTLATADFDTPPSLAVEQLSLSAAFGDGGLSLGYVGVKGSSLIATSGALPASASDWTRIGTLSYSRTLGGNWSAYTSVFRSFGAVDDTGGTLGLACFFDNHLSIAASGQYRREGDFTAGLQAGQSVPAEGTGPGWRLQASSGGPTSSATAAAGYRFKSATAEAGVSGDDNSSSEFAALRGAIVGMDVHHLPMLTNSIRESFALVDTGLPNVTVLYENRVVGRSGADSLLLIPNLTPQSRNQIAIDPRDVPPDAEVEAVGNVAVPLDRSGVLVKFAVSRADAATVILQLADGKPVPVGASVSVNDGAESFIVGYDGQAYVKHLAAQNRLVADWGSAKCQAQLEYRAEKGVAQWLGPLRCTIVNP